MPYKYQSLLPVARFKKRVSDKSELGFKLHLNLNFIQQGIHMIIILIKLTEIKEKLYWSGSVWISGIITKNQDHIHFFTKGNDCYNNTFNALIAFKIWYLIQIHAKVLEKISSKIRIHFHKICKRRCKKFWNFKTVIAILDNY